MNYPAQHTGANPKAPLIDPCQEIVTMMKCGLLPKDGPDTRRAILQQYHSQLLAVEIVGKYLRGQRRK